MATFERLSFYRGMSQKYSLDQVSLVNTRKDRRPKDTEAAIHQVADNWFNEKFGIRFRSQSLFVTSNVGTAATYGATRQHVFRIIPLGEYSYCWSESCKDMLGLVFDCAKPVDCLARLDNAGYRMDGLDAAYQSGHELMVFCDRYLAIPQAMLGDVNLSVNQSPIIVL